MRPRATPAKLRTLRAGCLWILADGQPSGARLDLAPALGRQGSHDLIKFFCHAATPFLLAAARPGAGRSGYRAYASSCAATIQMRFSGNSALRSSSRRSYSSNNCSSNSLCVHNGRDCRRRYPASQVLCRASARRSKPSPPGSRSRLFARGVPIGRPSGWKPQDGVELQKGLKAMFTGVR